jgi:tetratricopeptide (TPR) repeat protein
VIASLSLKLGKLYAKLNDYDNAFGAYRESIRILSETCGAADLRVGDVMFEVGVLMCDQGSSDVSDKSIECFTEMIRVYTENGEATHTNVANALIHKATALIDRSEYDEAGADIDEALKIYKSSLSNEAVEIGKAMLLYGTLHDAQNKNDDAMAAFNEALDIFRDTSTGEELNVSLALSNIGIIHARKAEFGEAVDKCKQALEIRKMHEGSDHDVAESLFNIGNILDQWSKEEALQYFEDSLKLYQSLPDEEDLAIANCLFKIGSVYWRRKNVNKSLRSYQESLRHCSNVEEEDVDSLLMSVYKGLADCYFEKDRYGKALDNYVECLKIQKVELEDGSTEIAYTCQRIGLIYQKEEEYENAMDFHSKALEILEASCDEGTKDCSASDLEVARILILTEEYEEALRRLENHLDKYCNDEDMSENVASVYELLGAAQRNLDQCNESIASLNKALDIRTKLFGETSAQVANTLVDLGRVMEDVSDGSDDAISLYDQAITIYQQIPDIDSAKVVGAYTRLAHLLDEKGNHEASLQSLKRALKLCSDCNGTESVEVAEILHRLGKTYDHLGNYEKSSACFTRSVKIFRSIDDDYGVYISQALSFVGRNYARRKQFGKAVELCTESLKMQKELIGEVELVDIAHSLLNIGDIMNQWDKPEQALQFYEEALNSYEEVVGFDSLDVAMCKYNIGVVKKGAGESEKALKCFGEALKIHRTKEGDKSLNVATDLFQIAQIYDSYGNLKKALACFEECVRIRNDVLDEDHLDVLAARRYVSTLRKKMMQ